MLMQPIAKQNTNLLHILTKMPGLSHLAGIVMFTGSRREALFELVKLATEGRSGGVHIVGRYAVDIRRRIHSECDNVLQKMGCDGACVVWQEYWRWCREVDGWWCE